MRQKVWWHAASSTVGTPQILGATVQSLVARGLFIPHVTWSANGFRLFLLWWPLKFLYSCISPVFMLTNHCKTHNMWKYIFILGTPWHRVWLRHCAASRKVASLVSLGFWRSTSDGTLTLGSTQPPPPNRNKYHEHFLWGKGGRLVGLTTLPTSYADCLEIWEPHPPGTHRACNKSGQGLLYLRNFYAMPLNFPKNIAVWKVPSFYQLVLSGKKNM